MAGDASFCNRLLFRDPLPRIDLICRARKNLRLCRPAPAGSRRVYGTETFTPEQIRQDESIAWTKVKLWHAGGRRPLRYKELKGILWRNGGARRPLRLILVGPVPYRRTKRGDRLYRQPAYLLTTDLTTPVRQLLQVYVDRWEIEVNHRDEKTVLGVGEAPLWSKQSVPRQPALVVAAYSALLLASVEAYGAMRSDVYGVLPKWRRSQARPSCLDLITLLRQQLRQRPALAQTLGIASSYEQMTLSAAA